MDMHDPSAASHMQSLFIPYHVILRKAELKWCLEESKKLR